MMQIGRTTALLCVALGLAATACNKRHPEERKVSFLHLGPKPDSVPTERRVEVAAVPRIIHGTYGYSLAFPANDAGIDEVYCGHDSSGDEPPAWFKQLMPGGVARVIVWENKEVTSYSDDGHEDYFIHRELGEVWVGDTCLFDAAICPAHKAHMERGLVSILYGAPSREFLNASQGFSGGPGFNFGGCSVGPSSPKEEFGYRCQECVTGYQEWCKKQKLEKEEDGQQSAPSDGDKPSK
jgi:hypothetical protein